MSAGVWALPASPFRFTLPVARIPLRGEDSLRVLHGQTTQAIEKAAPGSLIETCCVTSTARLVALAAVAVAGFALETGASLAASAPVAADLAAAAGLDAAAAGFDAAAPLPPVSGYLSG